MNNSDIILTLNGLLAHCRQSSRQSVLAVRRWGGQSGVPGLDGLCERIAKLRDDAIADLRRMVVQSGGTPDEREAVAAPPGAAAAAPEGGGRQLGALNACEQIENAALERYRDALDEPLPALVRQQIEQQYRIIEDNQRQLRRLRESMGRDCRV